MGEVYRAHDSNLRRDVALKVLPAALVADADRVARFEREARAVAALSHPNILAIHDLGSDDGISTPSRSSWKEDARDVLRGGPLAPWRRSHRRADRAGPEAHARGIVHRDPPENVVPDDGQVGILTSAWRRRREWRAGGSESTSPIGRLPAAGVTGAGTVLEPPGMAPEQVRGGAVDHAPTSSVRMPAARAAAGRRVSGESSIDASRDAARRPAGSRDVRRRARLS